MDRMGSRMTMKPHASEELALQPHYGCGSTAGRTHIINLDLARVLLPVDLQSTCS